MDKRRLRADTEDVADDRWREVLVTLLRQAKHDPEFRAKIESTGAVISNLEALIDRPPIRQPAPPSAMACRTYWWGFQLEIPHAVLADWHEDTDTRAIVQASRVAGPASAFLRRAAAWMLRRLEELRAMDEGAGVYTAMTWMAPNIFVAIPLRAPVSLVR